MPKYRRKPVVVEAVKITRTVTIETIDGTLIGNPGDYLITDANGEQFPCKAEVFHKKYEPITVNINMKQILKKVVRKIKNKTKEINIKN